MRNRAFAASLLVLTIPAGQADITGCACNHSDPRTLTQRECSLCAAAQARPGEPQFFLIRDSSPSKPNRWLALPRFHTAGPQDLSSLNPEQRTAYWTMAIAKGRELWGDRWGLAVNSVLMRSQCHMHVHIGKLREDVEDRSFVEVGGPADIPLPEEGGGMWVHPVADKLHVHHGNDTPELLLLR